LAPNFNTEFTTQKYVSGLIKINTVKLQIHIQGKNKAESMNAAQIEAVIQAALNNQEMRLRAEFANQISAVKQQPESLRIEAPEVE